LRHRALPLTPDPGRHGTFDALTNLELDSLALLERFVTFADNGRVMDEDDLASAVGHDESDALIGVEPLNCALCHGAVPVIEVLVNEM
jgi:hypothetical protein